jgi:pSer/pThr/pTyr-binding forkhead associated (FHA) protein
VASRRLGYLESRSHRQKVMKSFLAACGVDDSLQLIVKSHSTNESKLRPLYQPFAIIGRDLRADLTLDHSQVSRRHVYLQVVEGRAFWVDLESRTGTRSERESQKSGWLEGNRVLRVGPYVIRRVTGDHPPVAKSARRELPKDTPLLAQACNHAPLPEVALEFLNGPSQSMSRPVHRVLSLIGSASGCKFRLTDPSVSRFHGSLLQTPAGVWIVDLLGQKGITVNEVPVRSSRLVEGDVVRIGRYQIRIRCRLQNQGSGSRLFDLGRAALVRRSPRQDRDPPGVKLPDWTMAATSFEPMLGGAKEVHGSLPTQLDPSLPKIELMASNVAIPVNLTHSGLTDSLLVPLVNQFGLMQQQMFDQFQQAMAMIVQMFGTMHRDQMEVIRTELDRLHELTEEFHALKQELADRSQVRAEPELSERSHDSTSPDRSAGTSELSATPPMAVRSEPSNNLAAERNSPAPGISPGLRVTDNQDQQLSAELQCPPVLPLSSSPLTTHPSEQLQRSDLRPPARPSDASHAADSDRDTVVWLHQRIMALHDERESRWQRILKLLPGMSSS